MDSSLVLSVVLPTYSRAEILRRTLRHLADQTLDAGTYEVIVVDDGSPDHTEEVVRQTISQAPCPITYLRHENRGPGYTQNRGIRQASAPLILLLADDIFLTHGALEAHVTAHARHDDRRTAILGHVLQSPELRQTAFQRKWDPFQFGKLQQNQELPYWMFWACNISVKRDFMLEHGMFRDAMGRAGAAAHEDVEVGHRLSAHGLRIFHEKAALGYHYHPDSLEATIARSYQRGLNWGEAFGYMPRPELMVMQRVYGLGTLIARRRELTGERRSYLLGADRSMRRLAVRFVLRSILFNRLTVPAFWLPLMRLAERNRLAEAMVHPDFYRGVMVYHFRRACRDAQQKFGVAVDDSATEGHETRTGVAGEAAQPLAHDEPSGIFSRGAGTLVGSILGNAMLFADEVLVARYLAVQLYGLYALGFAIARITQMLGTFGLHVSAVRFISIGRSRHDEPAVAGAIYLSILVPLVTGCALGAAVWTAAPWLTDVVFHKPGAEPFIRVMALVIPLMSLTETLANATLGFGVSKYYVLIHELTFPVIYLAAIGLVMLRNAPPEYIAYGFACSQMATAGVACLFMARVAGPAIRRIGPRVPWASMIRYSFPILLNCVLYAVIARTDLLMLGALSDARHVGIYAACLRFVTMFQLISLAFNAATFHLYPAMAAQERYDELDKALAKATRWATVFAVPTFLVIVMNGGELLSLMGQEFSGGAIALAVLAVGQLVRGTVGSAAYVLVLCDRQRLETANATGAAIANVILNWLLIPRFGIVGAAAATSIVYSAFTFVGVFQVWHTMRLHALRPSLGGIVLLGAIVGAIAWAAGEGLNTVGSHPLVVMLGRVTLTGLLFAVGVWRFVLDNQERQLVRHILRKRSVSPQHIS